MFEPERQLSASKIGFAPIVNGQPAEAPKDSFWFVLARAGVPDNDGDILSLETIHQIAEGAKGTPFTDAKGRRLGVVREVIFDESRGELNGLIVRE